MESTQTPVVILTTVPDRRTAVRIASELVEDQLAACVKIVNDVSSVYQWQNEVVQDVEYQLMIKTLHTHVNDAYQLITEIHPYDVPEWVLLDATASEPYLNWMKDCLT